MGMSFPLKVGPSHGDLDPSNYYVFLGPPESKSQTASQSGQPFFCTAHCSSRQSVAILYNWPTLKITPSHGGSGPMIHWAQSSPQPKRHLDRFSRFCRAH